MLKIVLWQSKYNCYHSVDIVINYFFAAKKTYLIMGGFEINFARWMILIPTEIFHCQFRPVIALFDVQYFYSTFNIL